jgi:hypothetical protein
MESVREIGSFSTFHATGITIMILQNVNDVRHIMSYIVVKHNERDEIKLIAFGKTSLS